MPIIDHVGWLADRVDAMPAAELRSEISQVNAALRDRILPHESKDDAALYPLLARMLGGEDPMAAMSSTHREIFRLSRAIERLAGAAPQDGEADESRRELRRTLYALDSILRMHFAQEEEIYHALTS
jgi:iron-sulfur cluster repair protein YtfE (RIC family)